MPDKTSIQCLEGNLRDNGLILPTDFVIMKKRFKKELIKYYLSGLCRGQTILDLNPGFEGVYNELEQSESEYISLEQNPRLRSFLEERNIKSKREPF